MKNMALIGDLGFMLKMVVLICCSVSFASAQNTPAVASMGGWSFGSRNGPPITHKYDREDEVKKQCASVFSVALPLKRDDDRVYSITDELSFMNGDWWQESKGAPLLPFLDAGSVNGSQDLQSPMNLISFWVTDVDHSRSHRSKNSVSVSGVLQMGITVGGLFVMKPYEGNPLFNIWPGHSEISISFQGIYAETDENGGERVMCLLGKTVLPSRYPNTPDPWEWVKEPGFLNRPPLLQDDQILLVLRCPKNLNLTSNAIKASMKSLNPKTELKYFDDIHISAWLRASANYEFSSKKLVSKACTPYPYKDSLTVPGIDVYKGLDFCSILERFTHMESLTIVPNWRCDGTNEICSKLGPFDSDASIKATNGSFKDVKLVLQNVRCQEASLQGFTKVAAVFRVVPPLGNPFNVAQRTGLDNMTMSAEGKWESSSGQLCMVGCLGIVGEEAGGCDSRICLYVPLTFSIKQRSIVLGTFSSIKESNRSYYPLTFEKLVWPSELYDQYTASHPNYDYSKIDAAAAVLERNELSDFETVIKKSFLTFPKIEDAESYLLGLSLLSEDLTLHISAVPDPFPNDPPPRTDIQMEILSLGPLFGRYWSLQNFSATEENKPFHAEMKSTERQLLLNVSAQLSLTGKQYSNFSTLSVEGLYDPLVGKMYLIGCRDVRASWQLLFESSSLEGGLDCLVELVVSYPPATARWFANPTAKISISSQRNADDPLYFSPVNLQTFPVMYRKQREDILSRRGIEEFLRLSTLSVGIACILSQVFYIRDNIDSVPFISLVMLGVQALGYSLPLITGAEALFKKSARYESLSYGVGKSQWVLIVDYIVKLLVLVSFSLTLRLYQKVWRSRIRLLTRSPLEPHRVPSDKWVLLATSAIHFVGYAFVLIVHSVRSRKKLLGSETYLDSTGNFRTLREWETELEEYVGLVQDLFLLPQVIANFIWQVRGRPLRKLYFIGVTVVRLLPHIYDYTRSPVSNPYFSDNYEFVNPHLNFYSKFGDIAIPAIAICLAVVVRFQQKSNYKKLSRNLSFGKFRLLSFGSKMYERLPSFGVEARLPSYGVEAELPSVGVEAELVSGTNGYAAVKTELEEE